MLDTVLDLFFGNIHSGSASHHIVYFSLHDPVKFTAQRPEIEVTAYLYAALLLPKPLVENVARYLDQRQVLMRSKCLDVRAAPADGSRTVVQLTMKNYSKPANYFTVQ